MEQTKKPFVCTNCAEEFGSAEEVVNHIATKHALHLSPEQKRSWFGDELPKQLITEA